MKKKIILACSFLLASEAAMASDLEALMQRCAPEIHPTTLGAIVRTESYGKAFVISDDGPANQPWSVRKTMLRSFNPATAQDAVALVEKLTGEGHIVGIGLTQINSRNLVRLGLSVTSALEPCTNLRYGAKILLDSYQSAFKKYQNKDQALVAAISAYNTGDFENGVSNGYVQKVVNATQYQVPELKLGHGGATIAASYKPMRANLASNSIKPKSISAVENGAGNRLLAAKFAVIEVESF